jgi:hypothetical protein
MVISNSSTTPVEPVRDYFVWSMEHNAWWRPNHCGYTADLYQAGLYTKDEADAIVNGTKGRNERPVHASEHAERIAAASKRLAELMSAAGNVASGRDAIVSRVRRYLQLQESPEFKPCPRCNGQGYHHGFGEHGHDPDWCEDCGGPGEILVDDWEDGDELLKDVLAHLVGDSPKQGDRS